MLSVDVMNSYGFAVWTTLSRGWAFVAATFIIIVPLVQEVYAIWRQYRLNQQMSDTDTYENQTVPQQQQQQPMTNNSGNNKQGKMH